VVVRLEERRSLIPESDAASHDSSSACFFLRARETDARDAGEEGGLATEEDGRGDQESEGVHEDEEQER